MRLPKRLKDRLMNETDSRKSLGNLGEALAKAMLPELKWINHSHRAAIDFSHPTLGSVDAKASCRNKNRWSAALSNGADHYIIFLLNNARTRVVGAYMVPSAEVTQMNLTFTDGTRSRFRKFSLGSAEINRATGFLTQLRSEYPI